MEITTEGITRSFGGVQVLHDVSFAIRPGRITGFVGANGSGKTTTMRTILGVLEPDSGRVLADGRPLTRADRARFGYMPEERGLYPKMKVLDQLIYLGRLHGISRSEAREAATSWLERLGLAEKAEQNLEELSLGNQQRAQIAAALVYDPTALVLDEPFSGLDPIAMEVVLDVLREVAAAGAPVLFSSHQLDVVERLCDDLVIINAGQVVATGTAEELRAAHAVPEWTMEVTGDAGWVRDVPGITVVEFDGPHVRFQADGPDQADALLRTALERGQVASFSPYRIPLTRIFKEVVA